MKLLDLFVYLIIFIKVIFIGTKLGAKYYEFKGKDENKEIIEKLTYYNERAEFVFVACMSVLLIYLFNPRWTKYPPLDKEMRFLLYLYGVVIIFTAKWGLFFEESKWFPKIMGMLGIKKDKKETEKEEGYLYNNISTVSEGVNPYDDNVYTSYYANATYTGNTISQLPQEPKPVMKKDIVKKTI